MLEGKKSRRTTSGAFTQLNPNQVLQLKNAFSLLDNDRDGHISHNDLREMLSSFGKPPSKEYVDEMISEMPEPVTFSSYLTVMTDLLSKVSPKSELMAAFMAFEESPSKENLLSQKEKKISTDELEDLLLANGMSKADIDACFKPFLKSHGLSDTMFQYGDFVNMLCSNDLEE